MRCDRYNAGWVMKIVKAVSKRSFLIDAPKEGNMDQPLLNRGLRIISCLCASILLIPLLSQPAWALNGNSPAPDAPFLLTAAGFTENSPAPAGLKIHKEGRYFEVALPESWSVQPQGMGLSPDEKKVYGLTLSAPYDPEGWDGPEPRISAHYYAPENLVDKTPDKYIRAHSSPEPARGTAFPSLPKAADGKVSGLPVKIFGNVTYERGSDRSLDAKRIEIWESFAVIPLEKGYYALRYSAPSGKYAKHLPAFEAFIASFKPLE
ncbi:MAG: hypothetical protein PHD54_08955 [Desulfuromonadaceae bacterium]|nr:hypothetical protein [Desulfuromonadaceae bacterium]